MRCCSAVLSCHEDEPRVELSVSSSAAVVLINSETGITYMFSNVLNPYFGKDSGGKCFIGE